MVRQFSNVKTLGLSVVTAGFLVGTAVSPAFADVVRTGPNGRQATTTRTYEAGELTRTTTGSEGNSASTTRTYEDGTLYRTTTTPDGSSYDVIRFAEYEDGELTRTTVGPNGGSRTIIRSR